MQKLKGGAVLRIFSKKIFNPQHRWHQIVCATWLAFMLALPAWAYDVTVGGQSLGIILRSEGAVVVGFTPVMHNGAEVYPARDAGVQMDDRLLAINGVAVCSNQDVARLVAAGDGAEIRLTLGRGDDELDICVVPVLCDEAGQYRLGLYVRDANAGIGTLTFYDAASGNFAALGHKIENTATGAGNDLGRVLAADVQYVESSRDGQPGEKVGVFDENALSGTICKNCELGLYGRLDTPVQNPLYPEPMPVADAADVKPGAASILTVLEGETVEQFDIEIERVMAQKSAADKGMVIKITDERLLAAAGGIVQGMGVIDNRDNTKKPGNTGFFSSYPKNDPIIGV